MGLTDRLIRVERHFLVFEAPPEPFHEHVVAPAASPVHADLDALAFRQSGELLAGELTPLIERNKRGRE
jgi:hypothetical protein